VRDEADSEERRRYRERESVVRKESYERTCHPENESEPLEYRNETLRTLGGRAAQRAAGLQLMDELLDWSLGR
jgi:hypothetical protein